MEPKLQSEGAETTAGNWTNSESTDLIFTNESFFILSLSATALTTSSSFLHRDSWRCLISVFCEMRGDKYLNRRENFQEALGLTFASSKVFMSTIELSTSETSSF